MKVGFLGLGGMGAAMATRLVQAGLEVTLWNRSAAACEPLVALGATRAEEVGELFGLDVVISMLADDQAIRAVLLDSGALERARPGLIHLSMSTLSLDCVEALDQAHQRQGIAFVAAPVFGRTDVAEAGKLNIVVGGPEEAIEQVKALLEIMGQKTWFFGKDPRSAMAVKISGNFMIASAIESMGESVALVKRLGVEPGRFMELMSSTLFDAPVYRNYGPQIVEQRFTPARFRLVLGLKDVDLALSAGKRHNVPLPLASLLHDVLLEAIAHGDGESDWGCKPETQKFPSADQHGLSRAWSMSSCIARMTSSWVYDLALGSSASRRASSTSRVIRTYSSGHSACSMRSDACPSRCSRPNSRMSLVATTCSRIRSWITSQARCASGVAVPS